MKEEGMMMYVSQALKGLRLRQADREAEGNRGQGDGELALRHSMVQGWDAVCTAPHEGSSDRGYR